MERTEEQKRQHIEWLKCSASVEYWIETYVYIFNATDGDWVPFHLWPAQVEVIGTMEVERQMLILKARQLGLSWLVLCYALHRMLFRSSATVLLFSRRDTEAIDLLDFRLKGVYERLPGWMKAKSVTLDDKHNWTLSNGSSAKAFSTTGARGYTASIVIVDEADFIGDLSKLLLAVKPTIDAGGQIFLISTVDKEQPESVFKKLYRSAKKQLTKWVAVFLPWTARPDRDAIWYAEQAAESMAENGTLDNVHQEYPATDAEALASRTLDKRIPPKWLLECFEERAPLPLPEDAPDIAGLEIYVLPERGQQFVMGADTAEGNPNSDDSALTVLDAKTGEEVASLAGKFEPNTFGEHINAVGRYFNLAPVMVERNNHGHAVILYLTLVPKLFLLLGHDDDTGWLSSSRGKILLYNEMARTFRLRDTTLHSSATFHQLGSIDGNTLSAPKGQFDDRADSYALAQAGRAVMLKPAQKTRSREY